MRSYPQWRWHLDEVFVKVNGKLCYLWRAVDHEGEVLEGVVTSKRDKAAALKLLKRVMRKYALAKIIVTDGLRAYSAAMNEVGVADRQEVGPRLNNRTENSHQPFRRRERAMQRFRSMKTCRNSVQFTPRCTTISIRSGISSPGRFTSRDARLHWRSGAPLQGKASLRASVSRYASANAVTLTTPPRPSDRQRLIRSPRQSPNQLRAHSSCTSIRPRARTHQRPI
jgi:IS1 family transposase